MAIELSGQRALRLVSEVDAPSPWPVVIKLILRKHAGTFHAAIDFDQHPDIHSGLATGRGDFLHIDEAVDAALHVNTLFPYTTLLRSDRKSVV